MTFYALKAFMPNWYLIQWFILLKDFYRISALGASRVDMVCSSHPINAQIVKYRLSYM